MRKMRAIVKIHVVPHSQVFFKASKSTGLRCKSIGYRNDCACIAGLPALGDDQAIQLTQHMVGLRHSFSNNSRKLFMDNLLQLPLRKFSYRGVVPAAWNNTASLVPCVTNTHRSMIGSNSGSHLSLAKAMAMHSLCLHALCVAASKIVLTSCCLKALFWATSTRCMSRWKRRPSLCACPADPRRRVENQAVARAVHLGSRAMEERLVNRWRSTASRIS